MKPLSEKFRRFIREHKRQLIELCVLVLCVAIVSAITFVLLLAFDIVYFDDGINFNTELFDSFRSSWYGWIIFVLLHTVLGILLCAIPGASMAFILLSKTLYGNPWSAFLLSFMSVMISSTAMYLVGRFGGYKICAKMLGEEDCKKSLGLLRDKGTVFFPLMMMFPVFPDDALVMIAGTIKMKLSWFIPSIVVGRGIGIATIIFGLSLIPFDKFTTVWHWIAFTAICAVLIALVLFLALKLNRYLEARRNKSDQQAAEVPGSPADSNTENV